MRGLFDRLRRDRPLAFAVGVGAALWLAATVWFFTATDARGKTSRLTADAWYYHAYLPSLVYDRDLDFTDQYRITHNWYRFGEAPTGKPSNVFGIGPAIFELPLFAVGADVARLSGDVPNGFTEPEVALSLYASVLFSLAALLFVGRVIRRRLGGPYLAAVVPALLACAGPVVYYAIRQPGYAHPFATFWVAWLIDRWDQSWDGDRPRSARCWLELGGLLGLAALARPQLALWAVLFAPAAVDDLRRHRRAGGSLAEAVRRVGPRWAAGAALSVICVLPQLLAWDAIYGQLLLTPQGPGFMRWDEPAWSEVLFSSRNGLFPWAPLYAVAGVGLLVVAARRPRLGLALVAGVALQTVANGAAWDWWAGGSFGGRRFDSCFAAFAIGLAGLVIWQPDRDAPAAARWGSRAAAGLGVALSVALAAGNLVWASNVSAPTARIQGGQAAHKVLERAVPGRLGWLTARASSLANWPARLAFARRYGVDMDVYDYVVGHHQLGELYPGLNSFRGKTVDRLALVGFRRKLARGLAIDRGAAVMTAGDAAILVGLNRHGPVTVSVRIEPPAGATGELVLSLNGGELARSPVTGRPVVLRGTAAEIRRGTNLVEIAGPVGSRLPWLELRGPQDPRAGR
jgi:hypothetical protein